MIINKRQNLPIKFGTPENEKGKQQVLTQPAFLTGLRSEVLDTPALTRHAAEDPAGVLVQYVEEEAVPIDN